MARHRPPVAGRGPAVTAHTAALRLLGRREYSAREITTRLIEKGYAPDVVESAVQALVAQGAIDDRRMALAYTRTAARIRGRGRARIRRELEARGVAANVIHDALATIPAEDETRAIRRLVDRRRGADPLGPADRRRLFAQLLRRGFPSQSIARVLGGRDLEEEEEEDEE